MPPLVIFAAVAAGGYLGARAIAREWKRVNAELDAKERQALEPVPLEKDPETGVYRPRSTEH